ncbi:hypothetical protein ACFY2Y_15905 [Janibacter hoylei]|uniref:hypothetical protein n=1 Tax=Janibacter hoylei TaxID=364298 RepID=UPI0036D16DA6
MDELQLLRQALSTDLGEPAEWGSPVEFRDSLALCALNSVYSLRANSSSGQGVLARYRAFRPGADTDSGPDLVEAMDSEGGPEAFADVVLKNHSVLPGTTRLRTVGIHEALTRLAAPEVGVTTAAELREAAEIEGVKLAWLSVRGLGPLSWSFFLMNAGVDDQVKPDVMVQRYINRALGPTSAVSTDKARQLIVDAAADLHVTPRALDRAIWLHESPTSK